jgi:membrane protease subunit (stomatin/prohibitin family)
MRGRGVALVAGARMGQRRAEEAAAQQQAAAPAAAPASTDVTAEIQKLADLHDSGALTDEEFTAMKKKLLGL